MWPVISAQCTLSPWLLWQGSSPQQWKRSWNGHVLNLSALISPHYPLSFNGCLHPRWPLTAMLQVSSLLPVQTGHSHDLKFCSNSALFDHIAPPVIDAGLTVQLLPTVTNHLIGCFTIIIFLCIFILEASLLHIVMVIMLFFTLQKFLYEMIGSNCAWQILSRTYSVIYYCRHIYWLKCFELVTLSYCFMGHCL